MRGLYLSEGAMLVQQAQLQVISNNLANLRTPGFKREQGVETSFAEWMIYEMRPQKDAERVGALHQVGSKAHNVATQETFTSFVQGPLEVTERHLDFALVGRGFFQVEGEEEVLYTRNGRFRLDVDGTLVTTEGYPVLGEGGPITVTTEEIYSHRDGSLYYIDDEGQYVDAGRLDIAAFGPDAQMEKVGYNYFTTEEAPDGEEDYEVVAGFLEGSNVNIADEMVDMITAQRAYETNSQAVQSTDEMMSIANNMRM